MAEENKDQKTEEATSKRVRETEEKGQFANSRELTSMFVLMAAVFSFMIAGQQTTFQIMETWRWVFSELYSIEINVQESYRLLKWVMGKIISILGPILLIIMAGGLTANLIQTKGLKFSTNPLQPKFNKLNPLKGFGRIFSKNSLSELVKSLFKVGVLALIGFFTIKGRMHEIPPMMLRADGSMKGN